MARIKIKSIKILRAEGPSHLCGVEHVATSFADARRLLWISAQTSPTGGAYDKHDVSFLWEDGTEFGWRADVTRDGEDTNPTVYLHNFAFRIAGIMPLDPKECNYYLLVRERMREADPAGFGQLQELAKRFLSGELAYDD